MQDDLCFERASLLKGSTNAEQRDDGDDVRATIKKIGKDRSGQRRPGDADDEASNAGAQQLRSRLGRCIHSIGLRDVLEGYNPWERCDLGNIEEDEGDSPKQGNQVELYEGDLSEEIGEWNGTIDNNTQRVAGDHQLFTIPMISQDTSWQAQNDIGEDL